jgi:hypothetical protein
MARPAFNEDLVVRRQYLSLVHAKIPGESSWVLLDQGRVITPTNEAQIDEYRRIGDINVLQVPGPITHKATIEVYVENDLEELARVLGFVKPGGGWVGTETIKLDPTKVIDFKIENYDGITTAAVLDSTEYLNKFRPSSLEMTLDSAGDVRIANIQGVTDDYYITPRAAL